MTEEIECMNGMWQSYILIASALSDNHDLPLKGFPSQTPNSPSKRSTIPSFRCDVHVSYTLDLTNQKYKISKTIYSEIVHN